MAVSVYASTTYRQCEFRHRRPEVKSITSHNARSDRSSISLCFFFFFVIWKTKNSASRPDTRRLETLLEPCRSSIFPILFRDRHENSVAPAGETYRRRGRMIDSFPLGRVPMKFSVGNRNNPAVFPRRLGAHGERPLTLASEDDAARPTTQLVRLSVTLTATSTGRNQRNGGRESLRSILAVQYVYGRITRRTVQNERVRAAFRLCAKKRSHTKYKRFYFFLTRSLSSRYTCFASLRIAFFGLNVSPTNLWRYPKISKYLTNNFIISSSPFLRSFDPIL